MEISDDELKQLAVGEGLLNQLAAALLEARKELEQYRWIPVSERLPENVDDVNAFALGKIVKTYYDSEEGKWSSSKYFWYLDGEVTHWMPLPIPPEARQE